MIDENEPLKIATAAREAFPDMEGRVLYVRSLIAAGKVATQEKDGSTLVTVRDLREAHANYFSDDAAGPQEVAEQPTAAKVVEPAAAPKPIKLKKFNR